MHSIREATSRRRFVQSAVRLGVGICSSRFAARGRDEVDAFDSLPKSVWANARRNGLIMIHRTAPALLSRHTQIVRAGEPGQPLIVEGQVFAPDGQTPLEGATVYAYNTDSEGYYGSGHKEYPPRLYGWMKTDSGGRFELHTIHPGHYPGMRVPAHVHFTVWFRDYPPQWVEELRFEGDPFITADMLAEAAEQGEFNSIRPLTHTEDGVLHCRYKIRVQAGTNFR
ncbi:MAG: hypothetical protein M3Y72_05580 [Acidobacteriota bacterium]|nr:hypothetical protein [Acidobacteriota bacterium]